MYGAEIISINGNFDKALEIVRDLSSEHQLNLLILLTHIEFKDKKQQLSK